eukprot:9209378-Pyramimonas_sp.AAC.1
MSEPASASRSASRRLPPVLGPLSGEFAFEIARRSGEVLGDIGEVQLGPHARMRQPITKRGPARTGAELPGPRR